MNEWLLTECHQTHFGKLLHWAYYKIISLFRRLWYALQVFLFLRMPLLVSIASWVYDCMCVFMYWYKTWRQALKWISWCQRHSNKSHTKWTMILTRFDLIGTEHCRIKQKKKDKKLARRLLLVYSVALTTKSKNGMYKVGGYFHPMRGR